MGFTVSTGGRGGIIGKLVFSVFGLFFAFIGTQFVKQEWKSLQETKAMQEWTKTTCTMISSEMKDDGEDFKLEVVYRYEVEGAAFTGERYGRRNYYSAETVGKIDRMRKQLPPGKTLSCHYNPANPTEAVLKLPPMKGARQSIGFTLIFPAVGLLFATLPWLAGRKRNKNKSRKGKSELKQASGSGKRPLMVFGALFAGFALLMLYPLCIKPLQKANAAKTWGSVSATVISSKVKSHSSDDGTTYSVYIAYRYKVDGEEYIGDRYSFMGGSSSGHGSKAEIVRQFPTGHPFNVFVNPDDPTDSVIQRELGSSRFIGLIPAAFFIIGIIILTAGARAKKTKLDPAQAREQVVTLKGSSPVGKAIGITLFAAVWNTVVFFIFKSDAPVIFHILFGGAGLLVIGASIHSILAIFNPRPKVEITPGDIHPGTSVAMRWRATGRSDRIGTLTVSLQCLRITTETHRSGGKTRTTTVKTPVLTQELLQTDRSHEITQGTLQFRIPDDQSPSKPGNHGGIRWQLIFHGDIPRWPDLKAELPFTVYPTSEAL
jgi:hypothetical protein